MSQGVACFMIHCSTTVTDVEVARHVKHYSIRMPVVIDSKQRLGTLVGAKVTAEAIVVDRTGAIPYRSQINNLYSGYGKKRRVASKHYLQDAIVAVLAGKTVTTKETKPLGCFIHYADESAR